MGKDGVYEKDSNYEEALWNQDLQMSHASQQISLDSWL